MRGRKPLTFYNERRFPLTFHTFKETLRLSLCFPLSRTNSHSEMCSWSYRWRNFSFRSLRSPNEEFDYAICFNIPHEQILRLTYRFSTTSIMSAFSTLSQPVLTCICEQCWWLENNDLYYFGDDLSSAIQRYETSHICMQLDGLATTIHTFLRERW